MKTIQSALFLSLFALAGCTSPSATGPSETTGSTTTGSDLTVVPLMHQDAKEIATILSSFLQQDTEADPAYSVRPDPKTNSVLIQASPGRTAELQALIERIDQAAPGN